MICAGLVLTKIVLDGRLGAWDADVNQWFEARRAATWNDWSRLGSTIADTLTVIAVAALVVFVLAMPEVLARDLVPRHRAAPRSDRLRLDDVPRRP